MASDRDRHHMLAMIETMQREGRGEAAIVRAVKDARGESARPERRPLRKAVRLGRWRVEVARH
jgi:hypothetical protein